MADAEHGGPKDALCECTWGWNELKPGDNPCFHMPQVHPSLIKHIDRLTGGREGLRFLLPLCGKSLDMKWLQEKGHTVVGVEFVEKAAQHFFEDHGIEPTVSEEPSIGGGKHYKGLDGKISMYICNYFDFNSDVCGQFDAVWDRGSLMAMEVRDQKRYVDLTKSLMKPDARYMMETFECSKDQGQGQGHGDGHGREPHGHHHGNEQQSHGHPHDQPHGEGGEDIITGDQIKALFGDGYEFACLEDKNSPPNDFAKQHGYISLIYFLKPK
ncbi:probable thiopurine S-methyltransferase [Branchiostoma lanceolatum]|uniref:probable thiopurine S-methyltransferase n=1 Tax=Branchiostoma lanceolatum TaxID=7740 RepID=UPI003453861B